MKNRIVDSRPAEKTSGGKKDSLKIRFMRVTVIGILKGENLSVPKKRKAIDLLLGRNMALTDEELERLYEKLTRKSLKK